MPREVVHCDGPFHVKVGWAADREVQVGIEGDEGRSLNWLLYGDDATLEFIGTRVYDGALDRGRFAPMTAVELGRVIMNVLDCVPGRDGTGYLGVWATMDRAGINRLVRLLRRARDAAFGADA